MNENEILDFIGGETKADVVSAFNGMSQNEIQAELDAMFPFEHEENNELAEAIFDWIT